MPAAKHGMWCGVVERAYRPLACRCFETKRRCMGCDVILLLSMHVPEMVPDGLCSPTEGYGISVVYRRGTWRRW